MTELDNISLITVSELEGKITYLESLVTDIKTITESPYASDEIKVDRVIKIIKDYGY